MPAALLICSMFSQGQAYDWVRGPSDYPAACPGRYCGRTQLNTSEGLYSPCGPCPRGWRVNSPEETSLCNQCNKAPVLYEWLYIAFIVLTALLSHWVFIDYTAKRGRFTREVLLVHGSALLEVGAAALLTLLISEPVGQLTLHSCGVNRLSDWYPLLHNPTPNYETKLYCTQEVVYPLYSIVFIFYALSLLFMLLVRPWLSSRLLPGSGRNAVYAALYFLPILSLVHAILGGLVYYSFPYMIIILSLVSSAGHFACKLNQSVRELFLSTCTEPRNLVILLGHWSLHAFGIIAVTQLKETFHYCLLALVPFPALFYILTARFTDPYLINAIYDVN